MSVEAIQIHATPLEVNAFALDSAYRAWLADDTQWPEYKTVRHAYCATLQKSFENYQRAAFDAWSSLRRFRDPGRQARKVYLRRMVEESAARLEKLNSDDSAPPSTVVEAFYKVQRAKFDLSLASFPIRSLPYHRLNTSPK